MDIYDRLRNGLPHTRVFLEGVPENSRLPKDPTGLIKPLIVIWYGQLTDYESRMQTTVTGLCDEDGEDASAQKVASVLVEAIAPSGLSLLQLENLVRGLLTGFKPDDQGPLSETGSTTIRDPTAVGIGDTIRFYKPIVFSGKIQAGGIVPPITPPVSGDPSPQ
ncbi:hypothetical protein [Streptomyces sp. 5-10]|uniref:hypothetical protein n=1 Tax=Streptomyces sp. 5-10 TaxID=878925 RepID=UPI00168BDEB0|nr:hypothetical protein [Streptomyces sp. 5-10]MBD3004512.1 hypothetical protein [Streptomyces sp. 5-10]